jgi:hypothetical protein
MALDEEVRTKFCNFLDRHGFTDVEIVRQAPLLEATAMIGRISGFHRIRGIEAGALTG